MYEFLKVSNGVSNSVMKIKKIKSQVLFI